MTLYFEHAGLVQAQVSVMAIGASFPWADPLAGLDKQY
jgi:hypothetical protein